jgi:hypothetical protein
MKRWMYRFFAVTVCAVSLAVSLFLCEQAFEKVLEFRELERIPLSRLADSVGGESQVRGRVSLINDKSLSGPKSGATCVYYRYLVEREEKDSDGDTTWRTIRDEQAALDFQLTDDSGSALVRARSANNHLRWSVAQKYFIREGKYRYTEWRVDPGNDITVFGWMNYEPDAILTFPYSGHYQPIISSFTGSDERADVAMDAVLFLWGGVTALILACFCLIYFARIHRTLVFLVVISLSGSLLLFHYGYRSVQADLNRGLERVDQQSTRALARVNSTFRARGYPLVNFSVPFDLEKNGYGLLSVTEKQQINAWRRSAFQVRQRYINQTGRFPESYVARLRGLAEPPEILVPDDQRLAAFAAEAQYLSTRTHTSVWWVPLLLLVTGVLAWFAFLAIRTKRMQENIPTSKTGGVVFGLAEVKGKLVPQEDDGVVTGPLSNKDCVWYHYKVEEQRGSGKNKSWHTIADETVKRPFFCEDEEGRIRVFPGKAEYITKHIETERRGNRRYTERRLSPSDELYILGKARLDKTTGESLVIGYEKGSPYIIANVPEEEIMVRKAQKGMGIMALALSVVFFCSLLVIGGNGQMSSLDFLLASLVSPVFMIFVMFALMFNDLVFLRQRCERNWANIQVSLKKRSNLVPQLEQVVKQYLSHEADLQKKLVELRESRKAAATTSQVEEYLALEHSAIDQVLLRIEQYPDLKGIELVAVFNRRLIKLENEVALIRAGFNDAVTEYQTRRQSFPDVLIARAFGFRPLEMLGFADKAHRVPGVMRLSSDG